MAVNVLFFGVTADICGGSKMIVEDVSDTDTLRKSIEQKYPEIVKTNFTLALNQKITKTNTKLADGDTVAILPPFSGG